MNDELTEPYQVLGLKPGASVADVKAAHRDLAKVWHPDRFLHDLRLQQKAQEKLKEINEAYDLLTGKTKRKTPAAATREEVRVTKAPGIRWLLVLAPVLIFAVAFLFAYRSLLRTGEIDQSLVPASVQVENQSNPIQQEPSVRNNSSDNQVQRGKDQVKSQGEATEGAVTSESNAALLRPLPTVTVVIDPSTGMIARPSCPMKTSMTYPSGSEPHQYCSSHRAAPIPPLERVEPGESRFKSAAKRLAAPAKWLDKKTQ